MVATVELGPTPGPVEHRRDRDDSTSPLLPATGSPPFEVRRVLESLREVLEERAKILAQSRRLSPAWGEVRAVLSELKRVLGP